MGTGIAYGEPMPTLTLELPSQKAPIAFNLRRWAELLHDPMLARVEGRIETDRHGHILMAPPPASATEATNLKLVTYSDGSCPPVAS